MKAVRKTALLSAVAALSLVPAAAKAADAFWVGANPFGAGFTDPLNWQLFFVAGAGDRAVFSTALPASGPEFGSGTVTINQLLISGRTTDGGGNLTDVWTFFGVSSNERLRVNTDVTIVNVGLGGNLRTQGLDVFTPLTNITDTTSLVVSGSSTYDSGIVSLGGNGSFTVDSGNTLRGSIQHSSTSASFVSGLLDTSATSINNGGVLGIAPNGHIFLNGGIHTVSSGVLGFQNATGTMSFNFGAELRITGSGSLDFLSSHEFENGAAIRVTSGGRVVGASFLDLGISGTGSLSVDGFGSSISAASSSSFWGGGTNGVATVSFSNSGAGTISNLNVAQSNGSRGDVQILSSAQLTTNSSLLVGPGTGTSSLARITVNGGTLDNTASATFRNGGQLVMSSGGVNFTGDATFSTGSTFTMSGGNVNLTAGRTLNIAGGIVNRTGGSGLSSLPNGSTLRITNGGQFTTNSFYDIANGFATGTMLVDGAGSRFNSTASTTDWGQNTGNFATITFSNGGVGTYTGGLQISDNGGRAVVNLLSGGQLNANNLIVGSAGAAATITIAGGTLNTLSAAQFNNGALVNLTSGGLLLNGNTTFNTGATLNRTGGNLTLATGQTLAFNGGVGTTNSSLGLPNGASIRVTNAGRFDLGGFLDIGSGVATGSLAVDGANSRITALGTSDWGANSGNTATVTFSNSGAGTFNTLRLARFGGTANFSVNSNATVTAANFEAGTTGATALIQVNGGTLHATNQAIFANGANVSTSGNGVLLMGGNSTFFTGSTFNGTSSASNSGLQWADGTTLAFDGGAGTIAAIGSGVPNNGSLRITNGGSFTANENFNVFSGTQSLLVDGANSKLFIKNTTSTFNFWDGGTKTVEFTNSGAGTVTGGIGFANFGGIGTLNISTGGVLTTGQMFVADNGAATININGATLRSTSSILIGRGTTGIGTINITGGGTLQADGGIFTTDQTATNRAIINVNGGTLRSNTNSNINGGATLNFSSGTVNIAGTLGVGIVQQNARVLLTPGGNKVLRVGGLSIPAANGGKVDLSDNAMIVDYTGTSPFASIGLLIATGRNGGLWNGNGVTSSTAAGNPLVTLGIVEASEIGGPSSFLGQPIDNTAILTRYTFIGDANLSGQVNLDDFTALAAGFGLPSTRWASGDFNFDGLTNLDDFTALAANFGLSLPAELPRAAAVPEVSAFTAIMALLGSAGLFGRSRCARA